MEQLIFLRCFASDYRKTRNWVASTCIWYLRICQNRLLYSFPWFIAQFQCLCNNMCCLVKYVNGKLVRVTCVFDNLFFVLTFDQVFAQNYILLIDPVMRQTFLQSCKPSLKCCTSIYSDEHKSVIWGVSPFKYCFLSNANKKICSTLRDKVIKQPLTHQLNHLPPEIHMF